MLILFPITTSILIYKFDVFKCTSNLSLYMLCQALVSDEAPELSVKDFPFILASSLKFQISFSTTGWLDTKCFGSCYIVSLKWIIFQIYSNVLLANIMLQSSAPSSDDLQRSSKISGKKFENRDLEAK